ncbi:unnamed protein product [Penicillium salamii]|nr:unnamed protein product [Penicillium salamii]
MARRVAIIFYPSLGHIDKLAEAELNGIQKGGGWADLFQVEVSPTNELVILMRSPVSSIVRPQYLLTYDAILFGTSAGYKNFPREWYLFWEQTSSLWTSIGFWKMHAGVFVSTEVLGGCQEAACIAAMSTLTYHGLFYVPLGETALLPYKDGLAYGQGASAWGAGTSQGSDGSRLPSELELEIAELQGKLFYQHIIEGCQRKGGTRGKKRRPVTENISENP